MTTTTDRIEELEQFAADEGIELPMSAEEIAELEELGFVVDLADGTITEIDPDQPIELQPNTPERAGDWN